MKKKIILGIALSAMFATSADSADFPTSNGNIRRTGFVEETLKFPMSKSWEYQNTKPMSLFKETYTQKIHQPSIVDDFSPQIISVDDKVYFNSSSEDFIKCVNKKTGKEIWTFYANAPVRFAPAYFDGKILFSADDGYLYCLESNTGKELWRYTPMEKQRWCIGNGKFVSQWPSRSGVAIENGIAYFASGLFPPHGAYVCAVKIDDGSVVWNNKLSENHSSMFNGQIMIDDNVLYVPTGDTCPVEFNKTTGELILNKEFDYRRNGGGGGIVAMDDGIVGYGPEYDGVFRFRSTLEEPAIIKKKPYLLDLNSKMRGTSVGIFADRIVNTKDRYYLLRTLKTAEDLEAKKETPEGMSITEKKLYKSTLFALDKKLFKEALNNSSFEKKRKYPIYWASRFAHGQEDKGTLAKIPSSTIWNKAVNKESQVMLATLNSIVIGGEGFIETFNTETGEKIGSSAL